MKTLHGKAANLEHRIMARVLKKNRRFGLANETILVSENVRTRPLGRVAMLTAAGTRPDHTACIFGLPRDGIASLNEGDVVLLDPDGSVHRVWDVTAESNVVMVTNTCNCRCIMCPQPSCEDEADLLSTNMRMLELIGREHVTDIGLTGGEPTVRLDDLCAILDACKRRFPDASVSLLTNGRRFCDFEAARRIALIRHPDLTYCVALYGDVARLHDHIVGATNAFAETVKGLHILALLRQQVEIRVVLLRQNYERLPSLAEFIYRNFPFVSHVALMGMETTGLAWENIAQVWVDPVEYMPQLKAAVRILHQRDLRVSLYNLPLCLIPEGLWRFARDSISDWKKGYLPQCQDCRVRERCPGVFLTSMRHSTGIRPIGSDAE